jgi:hypothetical protein
VPAPISRGVQSSLGGDAGHGPRGSILRRGKDAGAAGDPPSASRRGCAMRTRASAVAAGGRGGVPAAPLLATSRLVYRFLAAREIGVGQAALEGDVAHVTYGDRVREIAAEWSLVLPPAS